MAKCYVLRADVRRAGCTRNAAPRERMGEDEWVGVDDEMQERGTGVGRVEKSLGRIHKVGFNTSESVMSGGSDDHAVAPSRSRRRVG